MSLKKIRILPDQYVFKQDEKGDSAYLIISGTFIVERDKINAGNISEGEIFGELSLILNANRTASIRAVTPCEIVEIKPRALDQLLLSSKFELHKVIKNLAEEIAKKSNQKLPIRLDELNKLIEDEPPVISKLAIQLHHRLSQMLYS
ncbi:MAG: hypothetical protein CMM91_08405 [Rickettsiales bacterium]|nr:hypothetical protein [Rickettsiales bacterium]|tara:strand:+ start:6916 stop:7356 length:441 start_codon:yes stop_codon:yes gene_type:complete